MFLAPAAVPILEHAHCTQPVWNQLLNSSQGHICSPTVVHFIFHGGERQEHNRTGDWTGD